MRSKRWYYVKKKYHKYMVTDIELKRKAIEKVNNSSDSIMDYQTFDDILESLKSLFTNSVQKDNIIIALYSLVETAKLNHLKISVI